MQLVIDVGNTRVKAAIYKDAQQEGMMVIEKEHFSSQIGDFVGSYPVKRAIISSVGRLSDAQRRGIQLRFPTTVLTHETRLPFINLYKTPETLGVDRMGLVAAFAKVYPKKSGLVIDAGSCITYDYLDEKGQYHGGAISPGLRLRYEAMHTYTANLPLLEKPTEHNLIGITTETAMHSGVVNGVVYEIEGIIKQYKLDYKLDVVVITGGDGEFLSKRLKNGIFADSNFLLQGLNYILTHTND